MPIYLAHKLTKQLAQARRENEEGFLLPDGKAQVTVEYKKNEPYAINNIIVSSQHKEQASTEQLKDFITEMKQNEVDINKSLGNELEIKDAMIKN